MNWPSKRHPCQKFFLLLQVSFFGFNLFLWIDKMRCSKILVSVLPLIFFIHEVISQMGIPSFTNAIINDELIVLETKKKKKRCAEILLSNLERVVILQMVPLVTITATWSICLQIRKVSLGSLCLL